jgi:hypothetical protein
MSNAITINDCNKNENDEIMALEGKKLQLQAEKELPVIMEKICKRFGI